MYLFLLIGDVLTFWILSMTCISGTIAIERQWKEDVTAVVAKEYENNKGTDEPSINDTVCALPKKHGFGPFVYSRWYYDNTSMVCKEFRYRGSGGNGNRFHSKEICSITCNSRCYQPVPDSHNDILDNPDCDGGGFEWYYHTDRDVCLPFKNSSCSNMTDTGNRFPTKHKCTRDCNGKNIPSASCTFPHTRFAVCNSTFILSGKVSTNRQKIFVDYVVDHLVVVVDNVLKGRDLLSINLVNQTADDSTNTADDYEIVSIRMIISSGQNCHDVVKDSTYIFMGYLQHGKAIIDDTSYVHHDNPGRRLKVSHSLNMCP